MATQDIHGAVPTVFQYYRGYETYMRKYHKDLFIKFYTTILPPRKIGDPVRITKGAHHSEADYAEIIRLTNEFGEKYPSPLDFPEAF
jgi:hypothetical protein